MPTVGPQLPPHLAKRKRSPEDDGSPPTKTPKATNPNEIDLDDSSDDGHGPSAPPPARASPGPQNPPIGPAMPPARAKNADEIDLSESDSDTGPAPAMGPGISRSEPSTQPARKPAGPSMPPNPSPDPAPKRTYGPSLPPPSDRPASPSSSDSDSDYGPALPSTSRRPAHPLPEATPTAPSKRDNWMLAPPTPTGPRAPDPTKLKARSFRSGPGAATPQPSGVPSIWTETPEEKLARLQDAVLGRGADPAPPPAAKDDEEQRRRVEAFTEQTRGKSLYEERKEARKVGRKKEEEEDDPSARPFDREKDMALGGKLGAAQKKEFVGKAAHFGDRFSKGSFL